MTPCDTRRDFLSALGLGAAALALGTTRLDAAENPVSRKKPNIIYILADDLGYGHLGCYGQKEIRTPHIDRMAAEGIRFTDHYSGSTVCAPARCVLMTGLHTGHCFVRNNKALPVEGNVPITADSQTIAKVLKAAGYTTACVGKWGLGYPGSHGDPIQQGFDLFFGYNCQRQAHSYYPSHLWRNDRKVMLDGNAGGGQKQYSHDLLTAEALSFIERSRERPFFLYLAYTIPHAKFQVPDLGIYADKPWPAVKKAIAAMITRMDRDVGRILALLEKLGIEDDTLVMFASDNGSAGGALLTAFQGSGPLRGAKGSMFEGGLRVPLIARWPGKIEAGAVSDLVSGFQDMLPTFAELAGAAARKPTDGISMVPTLLGRGTQKPHEVLYWERGASRAVRMGRWKAVVGKGSLQLFDLRTDLAETTDVAARHADVVAKIRRAIADSHVDNPAFDNWKYSGPRPDGQPKKRGKRRNGKKG